MEKVFELNPYGRCVANKIFNGKQYTLVWYVDENKVSQMGEKVVDNLINDLKKHFGELLVTRGKMHKFWGMHINITEGGNIEI